MATRGLNNFTPGIDDLVYGNATQKITPTIDKIASGKIALNALSAYKKAKDTNDTDAMAQNSQILGQNIANFGYGYIKEPEHIVPPVALTFYSFHIMVMLGCYFIALFFTTLFLSMANNIIKFRKILYLCASALPLAFAACEAGWIVAEVGRQPWAIQDLMPVRIAATNLGGANVAVSFFVFLVLFTALFIAEVKIMLKQIKIGF